MPRFLGLAEWQEEKRIPDKMVERLMGMPRREAVEKLYLAPLELYLAKGVGFPEGYGGGS